MTECEKCKCEYEETEIVIPSHDKGEDIKFVCKECYQLMKEKNEP